MGIDYLFYPEKVAAQEVINLLGHTSTTEYVDFSSGRLSLVVFRLDPTSSLIGRELRVSRTMRRSSAIGRWRSLAAVRPSSPGRMKYLWRATWCMSSPGRMP